MCLWMDSGSRVFNENGRKDRGEESRTGRAKLGVITDSLEWHSGLITSLS